MTSDQFLRGGLDLIAQLLLAVSSFAAQADKRAAMSSICCCVAVIEASILEPSSMLCWLLQTYGRLDSLMHRLALAIGITC